MVSRSLDNVYPKGLDPVPGTCLMNIITIALHASFLIRAVYVEMLNLEMALKTFRWVLGIELASCTPGKCSSTELYPERIAIG